jgi:hypothetical protein
MSTERFTAQLAVGHLHASFLAILPRIIVHGEVYFRFLTCPIAREDAIAEMVAVAWKWHLRLAERGKNVSEFASALATYAARAVNSGRRLNGMEPPKDVLSPRAQRERGFAVVKLPDYSTLSRTPFAEALRDNTQTPIPEQAAFRIDFPAWRLTRTERDRRVVDDLMLGERTRDVANRYGISPSRISQLRCEFHQDWTQLTADPADTAKSA